MSRCREGRGTRMEYLMQKPKVVLFKNYNDKITDFRLKISLQQLTAREETETDEHRKHIAHAQDVVQQVGRPQEQRCGDPEGGKVSKIIKLCTYT